MRFWMFLAGLSALAWSAQASPVPRDHGYFSLEAGKPLIFYAARNDEERVRVTICLSKKVTTPVHLQNTKDGVAKDDYAVFAGHMCLTRSAHIGDGFGFGLLSDEAPVSGHYTVRYLPCRVCGKQ